jgi:hypothetical protein
LVAMVTHKCPLSWLSVKCSSPNSLKRFDIDS